MASVYLNYLSRGYTHENHDLGYVAAATSCLRLALVNDCPESVKLLRGVLVGREGERPTPS